MATHHGNEGSVDVGANTVAEVRSWSIEESIETVRDSAMNDTYHTHLTGKKSWTGSLECHFDETDTNGQEALVIGASATLSLYPEGDGTPTTGDVKYTGTATVTGVSVNAEQDSVVSRTITFEGDGALTIGTV